MPEVGDLPLAVKPWGPLDAKLTFITDVPSEKDVLSGRPLLGATGELLEELCNEAAIDFRQCRLATVLRHRPKDGRIESLYVKKTSLPSDYTLPALGQGKYLPPAVLPEVALLHQELERGRPNLIVPLGNVACWALGLGSITRERGMVAATRWGKVLPTFSPSAIFRQWNLRVIVLADLMKAKAEAEFPEIRRRERVLLIEPTFDEMQEYIAQRIDPAREISFDIETKQGQITCIALAPSPDSAICIPFWDSRKEGQSYWSFEQEAWVWKMLRRVLSFATLTRKKELIAQNGLYDIQYLARSGVKVHALEHDTMLLHHAIYPEMKKGLGFLASIYTNELSWKNMVKDMGKDK